MGQAVRLAAFGRWQALSSRSCPRAVSLVTLLVANGVVLAAATCTAWVFARTLIGWGKGVRAVRTIDGALTAFHWTRHHRAAKTGVAAVDLL